MKQTEYSKVVEDINTAIYEAMNNNPNIEEIWDHLSEMWGNNEQEFYDVHVDEYDEVEE